MSHFTCIVQEHSPAHQQAGELEAGLVAHHSRHYPSESVTVAWRPIAAGHMFTEGRQSTSSVISCDLHHRTTRSSREAYMRGICDLWTSVTGCTDHEIVVSMTESPSAQEV